LATEICGCGFAGCRLDATHFAYLRRSAESETHKATSGEYSPRLEERATSAYRLYCAENRACDERYSHNERMRLAMSATARTRATFAQAIALGMAQVYKNTQCGATMLCGGGGR
jgi:hypothetical protein